MNARTRIKARVQSERGKRAAAPKADDGGSTPYQKLLRSAETGQFEVLVRQARPAEPVAMVTPEEREAALRAEGKWPAGKPEPKRAPKKKPPPAEPPRALSPRALSPSEQYIEEKCHWRQRGPNDHPRPSHPYGKCITEYDPITGEVEGDGYIHYQDDDDRRDDEW